MANDMHSAKTITQWPSNYSITHCNRRRYRPNVYECKFLGEDARSWSPLRYRSIKWVAKNSSSLHHSALELPTMLTQTRSGTLTVWQILLVSTSQTVQGWVRSGL